MTLVLLTLFACIIFAVFLYYRRRVSNLKTEIAHVHYTHDANTPGWPPANHNFDNPVYGMQAETRLLPNNMRSKMNNFDQRSTMSTDYAGDDSNASGRGTRNRSFNPYYFRNYVTSNGKFEYFQ